MSEAFQCRIFGFWLGDEIGNMHEQDCSRNITLMRIEDPRSSKSEK